MRIGIPVFLAAVLYFAPAEARPASRIVKPATSLKGTSESLAWENKRADDAGLERIKSRTRLEVLVEKGELVPIADVDAYQVDEELGQEDPDRAELYVHARPWVKRFLDDVLGEAHRTLGFRFAITSLVRPDAYQKDLRRSNRSAAAESTHGTGSTVDIALVGLTWTQKQWVRKKLLALEEAGLVEATEEPLAGCFHVFVSPEYGKDVLPAAEPAPTTAP